MSGDERWQRWANYLAKAGRRSRQEYPEYDEPTVADDLYLDMLLRRADIQFGQMDAIDSKSATAFAAASGLLPITLGLLGLASGQKAVTSALEVWLIFLAVLAYALLSGSFYLGYRLARIDIPPSISFWNGLYREDPLPERARIVAGIGNRLLTSIAINEELIEMKAFYAKVTMLILFVDVGILTTLAILSLL